MKRLLCLGLGLLLVQLSSSSFASTFGVNAHVPAAVVIDEVVAAGIGWVRIDFIWSEVEPERDAYQWQVYDRLLDRLEAGDLRVYATLQGTPAWATSQSAFSGVPDDAAEWQEFVYLAAARYRGRIDAWGLWNEPNLRRFWGGSRTEYIEKILIPGARAVHAADPGALVCGPDLAHLGSADWDGWLRQVIREAGGLLDVVTHHFYPGDGRASDVVYDLDEKPRWMPGPPSVREVLQSTGWWGRPFWLTETGVESARGPILQADFYDGLIRDWFGRNPQARWMDRVFFYQIHDPPTPDASTFGILGAWPELEPKQAFYAYRNAIADTEVVDGEVLELDAPAFVRPGQIAEVALTLLNSGTTSWRGDTGFHLDVELDTIAWRVLGYLLPNEFEVRPGETAHVSIPISAPWLVNPDSPSVRVFARMVSGDGRRFGDPIQATITATLLDPPQIIRQPVSAAAPKSNRVTLSTEVLSETRLTYRWRRNSVELTDGARVRGSQTSRLTLLKADSSVEGYYDCVVTNEAGDVVTTAALITVEPAKPRPSGRRSTPN